MTAFIVLRNSTDKQAKAGTIDAQREPVYGVARKYGAADIVEMVEAGVSGATALDDRAEMLRLLALVKPGDLVCAFDLSRLTRGDMFQRAMLLGGLAGAGARIITVEDGEIDLDTMGGRITLAVKGEVAYEERKKIRSRTHAGKQNRAREGGKPQGRTPYGWNYVKATRTWSLDEATAKIRTEILVCIIEGVSCGKIAEDFNARKIKYPALKRKKSPTGRAKPGWTARRVWHFAVQSINKGEWRFDGHLIKVPPLVDAGTFEQVLVALSKGRDRGRRRTSHIYYLDDGHGRCGLCGAPLRIQWGARDGDVAYYVCQRRLVEKACDLPWWRISDADALVWGEALKVLERPDLVEEALRARMADTSIDGGLAAKDIAAGEARLAHLASVREMFMRQAIKGSIPENELARVLDRVAREATLIGNTIAAAREQADRARAVVADIGSVRAWLALVRQEADQADDAERRRICRALAPSVTVGEKKIEIRLRLREPDRSTLAGSTCS